MTTDPSPIPQQPDLDLDEIDQAIVNAAHAVMKNRDDEAGMPTKVLLMYEYVDDKGERGLSWRSVRMVSWDRMGFVSVMLAGEQASFVVDATEES